MNQYSDNDYAFAYDKALKRYMSDGRNLFSQEELQNCCEEYRKHKEEYGIKGFNLFKVLAGGKYNNLDYGNEQLHSNILKFLLDPEEEHGQDDIFLHKFITFLNNEHNCKIDLDHYQHAEVTREENYIDVLIKGNKHAIIIENKVSGKAGDQPNQIYRYYKDVTKKEYEVDAILYLTRNSSHPVNLEGLLVTESSSDEGEYNKIQKDIKNRIDMSKTSCTMPTANTEKEKKSLYYGFFKPCKKELCGVEKHGELFTMLEHYLEAVKTFGGEEMNEGTNGSAFSIH